MYVMRQEFILTTAAPVAEERTYSPPRLLGEEHWQCLILLLHGFCTTLTTPGKDLSKTKLPSSLAEKVQSTG